jgi:hypothetical protein
MDEAAARAVLLQMAPRLGEQPHSLLGVPADAGPDVLRKAFLRLTKQFHPQKFARFSPDVIRLANEVFLTIKRAYDQLSTASAVPRPGVVASGTGAVRAAGTTAPPHRAATTPGPAVPPAAPPPRARPPATTPAPGAPPPRARTVPGTPAPVPGTMRPSAAIPKVTPPGPDADFEAAQDLLRRKLWSDARQAFQKLAVSIPQEKKYRAFMHYARAREAHDAGKLDEARAELQRALALDPDLVPAKLLLNDLAPEPGGGGGMFKKIFKR